MFESGVDGKPFTSAARANLAWSLGPSLSPEKTEFGDAISRCFEGLTCSIQYSQYSIAFSIPPLPALTISMQIFTNYESIVSTVGEVSTPQTSRGCASVTNP